MRADLRASAREYLAWRRAMGYQLGGCDALISQFLDYLADQQEDRISVEHALAWACLPHGARPRWHAPRSPRSGVSPPTCTPTTRRPRN